jgi:hypothetical protein
MTTNVDSVHFVHQQILINKTTATDADVVIASTGTWFNYNASCCGGDDQGEPMWKEQAKLMLKDLDTWQRQKPSTRVAIIVETVMQHFTNPAPHFNVYKYNSMQGACGPITTPANQNQFRGDAVIAAFEGYTGNVRYLPTRDIFLTRWQSHANSHGYANQPGTVGRNTDCTHYCWYSWLYEPLWERVATVLLFDWEW